jgi:hypothetical protein
MAAGPIELLDGLVKGFILAVYDFVRLTFIGLLLPFFRNTRRIWPTTLSISKRLSTLTYLVLWAFIAIVALLGDTDVVSQYLGLPPGKNQSLQASLLIATALLMAMFGDLVVRSAGLMIKNETRRQLYESVARIAVANVFVGMLIVIAIVNIQDQLHPRLFGGAFFTFLDLARLHDWPAHAYLAFFGLPLAIVAVKAFRVRHWRYKLLVGLPAAFCAPAVFLIGTFWLLAVIYGFSDWLSPAREIQLRQQSMRCKFFDGKTRLSGFLKLDGGEALAVNPQDFAILLPSDLPKKVSEDGTSTLTVPVLSTEAGSSPTDRTVKLNGSSNRPVPATTSYGFDPVRFLGRGDEDQPPIALSGGGFIPINIVSTFSPVPGGIAAPPQGGTFNCQLGLLERLSDQSNAVKYGAVNVSPDTTAAPTTTP